MWKKKKVQRAQVKIHWKIIQMDLLLHFDQHDQYTLTLGTKKKYDSNGVTDLATTKKNTGNKAIIA